MKNIKIAKALKEMSIYLEMKNIKFKPQAYEKAAYVVGTFESDIEEFLQKNSEKELEKLPGIGVSIAEKITEYLKTGKIKELEELKKEIPVDIEDLIAVEGIGSKIIYKLYQSLKIKNLKDLEKACKEHKIKNLPGFGEKSEEKILKGIEFVKQGKERILLGNLIPVVEKLVDYLNKNKAIKKVVIAGSYRRKKETIGDIDILVISNKPDEAMQHFVKFSDVVHIYAKGPAKTLVRLRNNLDADLRVIQAGSFGAALAYFTGSKDHNIAMRELAAKKGWKLNEYGLFQISKEQLIAGRTENEIYEKLGMQFIEPEMRESQGELELALNYKVPQIVKYGCIKGDLQIHTTWSEGENSIEEMAKYAKKIGLEYICITDHTKSLKIANGLDEKRILEQISKIKKLNSKFKNRPEVEQSLLRGSPEACAKRSASGRKSKFTILSGAEVNILKDGSLDINNEILAKLDFVGAAIHTNFNLSKNDQTERIKKAMANKNIDCIFHPTGRLINRRPAYEIDIDEIIDFAKETNTILEINAFPSRLDLKDDHIRKCVEKGVKMIIATDSHHFSYYHYLDLGVAQARRGWAKASDILNTLPLEKFLKRLVKNK